MPEQETTKSKIQGVALGVAGSIVLAFVLWVTGAIASWVTPDGFDVTLSYVPEEAVHEDARDYLKAWPAELLLEHVRGDPCTNIRLWIHWGMPATEIRMDNQQIIIRPAKKGDGTLIEDASEIVVAKLVNHQTILVPISSSKAFTIEPRIEIKGIETGDYNSLTVKAKGLSETGRVDFFMVAMTFMFAVLIYVQFSRRAYITRQLAGPVGLELLQRYKHSEAEDAHADAVLEDSKESKADNSP